MPYKSRRSGLTGNQLKIIGIAAVLIDNIGAVVIQRYILMEAGTMGGQLLAAAGEGRWLIAGQACRYVGRLGFPILAFLTVEEFVRARERGIYAIRLLATAVLAEVPFDLAVYGTAVYPYYQNMMFTLFIGVLVITALERTEDGAFQTTMRERSLSRAAYGMAVTALGCAVSWLCQCDYNVLGVLFMVSMYCFRRSETAQLISGVVLCAVESVGCYCISALSFVPIMLYNGRRGTLQLKYLLCAFYPLHFLALLGIGAWIGKGA